MSKIFNLVPKGEMPPVVANCKACGGPIYPRELVYQLIDGGIIHRDGDCLWEYSTRAMAPAGLLIEDALKNAQ